MKRITVKLTKKAEKAFNEIMYSLPKDNYGTGMCTQSQAVSYALECVGLFEKIKKTDIPSFFNEAIVSEDGFCRMKAYKNGNCTLYVNRKCDRCAIWSKNNEA